MAVVFIGHRRYGRVHAHGGEYAETVFAHLSFIPIFPLGSYWVTNEAGPAERVGFPIKLNGRSVLAAYLRTWVVAISLATFLATSLTATAVAIALAGLSAWSWTWWSRRGVRALQRSDFDRVALGSRCDPTWMTADMRADLSRKLDAQLAARDDARPPDDVAQLGARDLEEARLAYGLLRIAGVQHASARRAADRLLASAFDGLPSQGSPYRDDHGSGGPGLGAQISAAAQVYTLAAQARLRASAPSWYHDRWFQLFALVALAGGAGSLLYDRVSSRELDDRALRSLSPPIGARVSVHCDRVNDRAWELSDGDTVKYRVKLCWINDHALPVVSEESDPVEGPLFEGKLESLESRNPRDKAWIAQLHGDVELDARSYSVFLDGEGETARRAHLMVVVLAGLGAVVGWPLWIRSVRRRRRGA